MAFATYTEAATKLRDFLRDKQALNILDGVEESTDTDLIDYIKSALIDINNTGVIKTTFGLADIIVDPEDGGIIPWTLVKLGATLEYLTSAGILGARNTLTYSDAGGEQVSDMDRWGRYINYFNTLVAKYTNGVQQFKGRLNFTAGYGGVNSPMQYDSWSL